MATATGTSNGYTITLTVTQSSQSIENNTSTLSWSYVIKCTSKYYQNSSTKDTFKAIINGTTVLNTSKAISFSGQNVSITIGSGTTTVAHNTDGTKSVSFSVSYFPGKSASYYPSAMSGSGSMTLTTIARASSIGTISGSTIGSAITIPISRASNSFTHTLTYKFGSTSGTIGTGLTTSASWTPATSLCSQIPNATSGTCTLTLTTLNGSTTVGTSTKTFTLNIPSSAIPSISSQTISEAVSGLATQFGAYVQNKSKLKVVISASGYQGSTISSYSTTILGTSYSGSTITSGLLSSSGTVAVVTTVKDSRGKTASKTTNVTVVAYSSPVASSLTVQRCDSVGTVTDSGLYIKATYSFSIASVGSKNTHFAKLQYNKNGTWTDLTSNTSYSASGATYTSTITFSEDNSWDFRLYVADYFTSTTVSAKVGTAFTLINYNSAGHALAFGKVSEVNNSFEVALATEISSTLKVTGGHIYAGTTNTASGVSGGCLTTTGNLHLIGTAPSLYFYANNATSYTNRIYTSTANNLVVDGGNLLQVNPTLYLTKTTDASGTADNRPALIIGTVAGTHLEIDGNEIQAKASGTTTSDLSLNWDGGTVYVGTGGLMVGSSTTGASYLKMGYNDGYRIYINATGSWARSLYFTSHKNGTNYVAYGAYGTDETFHYAYVGPSYNSTWVRFTSGGISLPNGLCVRGDDTSGTSYSMLEFSSNNNVVVGYGAYTKKTYTNVYGGKVQLINSSASICFDSVTDTTTYNGYFRPNTTNKTTLGTTSYRWYCLYQYLSAISTSDEREKHDILAIDDLPTVYSENSNNVLEKLFFNLTPKIYCMNHDENDEINNNKMHIGFVAQDVAKVLKELGISEEELGLIQHDFWTDENTGEEKDLYGLSYTEFIGLNTHMIQKLYKQVVEQQKEINELKEYVNGGI